MRACLSVLQYRSLHDLPDPTSANQRLCVRRSLLLHSSFCFHLSSYCLFQHFHSVPYFDSKQIADNAVRCSMVSQQITTQSSSSIDAVRCFMFLRSRQHLTRLATPPQRLLFLFFWVSQQRSL